jgi:hypothetical protein
MMIDNQSHDEDAACDSRQSINTFLSRREADDEISLLDLFLVLLRQRRCLIAWIAAGVILGILCMLFMPDFVYKSAVKNQYIELDQKVIVQSGVTGLLPGTAQSYFLDPATILASFKEAGIASPEGDTKSSSKDLFSNSAKEGMALSYIRQRMILGVKAPKNEPLNLLWAGTPPAQADSKLNTANPPDTGNQANLSFDVGVYCKGLGNQEKYKSFLSILCRKANEKMAAALEPVVQSFLASYKPNDLANNNAAATLYANYLFAKDFQAGNRAVASNFGSISVYQNEIELETYQHKCVMYGIIIIIAFIFLGILLSFIFDAIANVKSSEEAMDKIHAALGKSKRP